MVSIGSDLIKESELKNIIKSLALEGPDPHEGLISKITQVLDGNQDILETLNEEELEVMKQELSVI